MKSLLLQFAAWIITKYQLDAMSLNGHVPQSHIHPQVVLYLLRNGWAKREWYYNPNHGLWHHDGGGQFEKNGRVIKYIDLLFHDAMKIAEKANIQ